MKDGLKDLQKQYFDVPSEEQFAQLRATAELVRTYVPVSYTHLDVYKRQGLDKTIQNAIDGSCAPGLFPLVSIPTIVGCVGALLIIIAAIATPIAKTQKVREAWFYVMSSGAVLKIATMESARIILR